MEIQPSASSTSTQPVAVHALSTPVLVGIFAIIWAVLGLVPLLLIALGPTGVALADSTDASIAGTIGDAFGLANSFFSAGAFAWLAWSVALQREQLEQARRDAVSTATAQQAQIDLAKDAAALTAINHIYAHYSDQYGRGDETKIRNAIAEGHRRWAIRGMFGTLDRVFAEHRVSQVAGEVAELKALLSSPRSDSQYFKRRRSKGFVAAARRTRFSGQSREAMAHLRST